MASAVEVDWSSLPSDLVGGVADVFLATSDVDYYMSLRAVCRNWRACTDDPCVLDPRFHPRRWVILSGLTSDDGCLFLNVETARLLRKDLPVLRRFDADGLLVAARDCEICLLNPFTGRRVSIPVALDYTHSFHAGQRRSRSSSMVVAASSSSSMLYTLWNNARPVARLYPTRGESTVFTVKPAIQHFTGVATFEGRVYAVDREGTVVVMEDHAKQDKEPEMSTIVAANDYAETKDAFMDPFLVDNAGDLLIVRLPAFHSESAPQVFRVDVDNKSLEAIGCIGNRAIFLMRGRCLSVDADNLSTIHGNSVYYVDDVYFHNDECWQKRGIYVLHLEDGREELVSVSPAQVPYHDYFQCVETDRLIPTSFLYFISDKCRDHLVMTRQQELLPALFGPRKSTAPAR